MRGQHRMTGEAQINATIYAEPDPKKVWIIARDYGLHAAFARWSWMPKQAVGRLAERGRALTEGGRRSGNTRRTISEAVEREIVAAVFELGGVSYASKIFRVTDGFVAKLLREHGYSTWPRASRKPEAVAAAKARVAAYLEARV
ncbi:hypothetical protein ACFOYU_11520 [Microvirga sp. GCM10011540]|uniref:hypothetical protein n=1 Tax=Microvirga sp. GCM10011540 TaxID=3317338 RepID=UPI003611E31D